MDELPGLVEEVFRMSGIEVSDGGEEMGGVHAKIASILPIVAVTLPS